jgi:TatD DNase family protein
MASIVDTTALPPLHDIGVNFGNEKKYPNASVARLLGEARAAGVTSVVSITNSLRELPRNRALAAAHADLCYTAGVHPHCATEVQSKDDLEAQIVDAFTGKCVAVGECGLDYDRNFSPRDAQLRCFRWHVEIARALGKPLYLHCRSKPGRCDAFDDMIAVLDEVGLPAPRAGVVHCFTGPPKQATEFCARGFYLGVTGWLLDGRRNADLAASVASAPLDRLLVETDAPWMPLPGKKASEPKDVVVVALEIARLKGVDAGTALRALATNATAALGLPDAAVPRG